MNEKNSMWYVVLTFSIIALLLIQSIIVSQNIYDFIYLICIIIFMIRFILIKKNIKIK